MCGITLDRTRTFLSALIRSIACRKAASSAADSSPSMNNAPTKNGLKNACQVNTVTFKTSMNNAPIKNGLKIHVWSIPPLLKLK